MCQLDQLGQWWFGGANFKIKLPQLSIIANQPVPAEYPTNALYEKLPQRL